MKTIRFYLMLSIVSLSLLGCGKNNFLPGSDAMKMDYYWLTVSFKDASGKDLVAKLGDERWVSSRNQSSWAGEINPERYKLDIVLSNPHESWDNTIYNTRAKEGVFAPDVNQPYFMIAKYDENHVGTLTYKGEDSIEGDCYLFSNFNIPAINGIQNTLTYKITCPTIFGDNATHEIVTWWKEGQSFPKDSDEIIFRYPECKSSTFDGKDVIVKKVLVDSANSKEYYSYFIDIVIDK